MTSQIDLPLSITNEIVKNILDSDILLSKNTKLAFSRIGGVFILYISHIAQEITKSKGRTKITVNDIKEALSKAGFNDFLPKLNAFVEEYEKKVDNIEDNELDNNDDTIILNDTGFYWLRLVSNPFNWAIDPSS